ASSEPHARLEAISALGGLHGGAASAAAPGLMDVVLDAIGDPSPPVRAAALRSASALDPEGFVTVLSGLDPDPHWTVRAPLASGRRTLDPALALPRLTAMLADEDQRVVPSVLAALVALKAPNAADVVIERLKADDPAVRAAAANGVGELKPPAGAQ